jgi:hypothetical protein
MTAHDRKQADMQAFSPCHVVEQSAAPLTELNLQSLPAATIALLAQTQCFSSPESRDYCISAHHARQPYAVDTTALLGTAALVTAAIVALADAACPLLQPVLRPRLQLVKQRGCRSADESC